MEVTYKKLWKLLMDKRMKNCDLERKAKISHYALRKLRRNQVVSTEVLRKICNTLDCAVNDIMEFTQDTGMDEKSQ